MARKGILIGLLLGVITGLLFMESSPGPQDEYADSPGFEFVIPGDFTQVDLGEAAPESVAVELRAMLQRTDKAAAVYSHKGDAAQILADLTQNLIDERVKSRHGTVRRVLWKDHVVERLE